MTQPVSPEARNVRVTALWALSAITLLAAAAIVGTADNPPGLALAWAASAAGVLAVAHPWRRPQRWLALAGVSLLAGFASAILHNFPEVLGQRMTDSAVVGPVLSAVGVTLFLLAIFVAPAGIAVGLLGGVVTAIRNRLAPLPARAA